MERISDKEVAVASVVMRKPLITVVIPIYKVEQY